MNNKKLNGIVMKELLKSGKEGGLGGIEMLDGVVMSDEEWNPQNVGISLSVVRALTLVVRSGFVCDCTNDVG